MISGDSQSQRPNGSGPKANIRPKPKKPMDNKLKLRNIKENSAPKSRLPPCKSSHLSVFRRIQEFTSTARSPVATGSGLRASNRPSLVVRRRPASQLGSDNG